MIIYIQLPATGQDSYLAHAEANFHNHRVCPSFPSVCLSCSLSSHADPKWDPILLFPLPSCTLALSFLLPPCLFRMVKLRGGKWSISFAASRTSFCFLPLPLPLSLPVHPPSLAPPSFIANALEMYSIIMHIYH